MNDDNGMPQGVSNHDVTEPVSDTIFAQFSVVTKSKRPLTKIMRLDPKTKEVVKDGTECWMAEGEIKTVPIKSFQHFADGIRRLKNNQALVHGISEYVMAFLTTKSKLAQARTGRPADASPVIARSKEYFQYPDGPALLMLDHDKARKDSVVENESALRPYRPAELVALIAGIMPKIARAGHVSVTLHAPQPSKLQIPCHRRCMAINQIVPF